MNFWVKKKKMLNAKLECHLTGPHTLSHEVSEKETFCNNFYSTIFLQFFFLFTHSLNWIIIMVICAQFVIVVLLLIYSLFKVKKIFFFNHETKNKCKRVTDHENQLICFVFTYLILWNKSMFNSLTIFDSSIVRH